MIYTFQFSLLERYCQYAVFGTIIVFNVACKMCMTPTLHTICLILCLVE